MRHLPAALLLAACSGGGSDEDPTDGTSHSGAPSVPLDLSPLVVLDDTTSFTWSANAAVPRQEVVSGADFVVDFSGLTTDLWGRPRSPSDVLEVQLQARADSPDAIEASVGTVGADHSLAMEYWYVEPGGRTRVNASEFSQTGHLFEPNYWATQTQQYLVALVDADLKTISATIVTLGTSGAGITVGDARVEGQPTFGGVTPATASDLGPWTIDWSALTHDSLGEPQDPLALEQLFVARFDSEVELVAGLTAPELAGGYWVKYVAGRTSVPAEEINDLSGTPFPGFTPDGAWLVGARCASCATAVPQAAVRVLVPR